jgi:hypothetical protein
VDRAIRRLGRYVLVEGVPCHALDVMAVLGNLADKTTWEVSVSCPADSLYQANMESPYQWPRCISWRCCPCSQRGSGSYLETTPGRRFRRQTTGTYAWCAMSPCLRGLRSQSWMGGGSRREPTG